MTYESSNPNPSEQQRLLSSTSSSRHNSRHHVDAGTNDDYDAIQSPAHHLSVDVETGEEIMDAEGDPALNARRQIPRDKVIRTVKYTVSFCFMAVCLLFITRGIFRRETAVAMGAGPVVAFSVMWILIAWLGMLEGGQGSLVGLQPIDRELYRVSHPSAHKCTELVYEGDNLNRFIVGRQFLVVLVVFCLNLVCTPIEAPPAPPSAGPGPDDIAVEVADKGFIESFLDSGLPVMLITVILGQLAAEVNATNCMLDFINTPLMVITTWICLAIEASGLLHATYLVNSLFSVFDSNASSSSSEEKQDASSSPSKYSKEKVSYWGRVGLSSFLLAGAMAVTWVALLTGQTTMSLSGANARIVAFFILSCFLGILEAMQIAVFAVSKLPESELAEYPTALANSSLVFEGTNFKAFLTGRQICVTMSMFLLARLTTTEVDIGPAGEEATVLGISDDLQFFFNTGLPGALITTIVASLFWRIVASSYPIPFLSNPTVKLTIQTCLALEASGIFSISWLLADVIKSCMTFQTDDSYLTAAAARAEDGVKVQGDVKSLKSWETSSTVSLDEEESSISSSSERISPYSAGARSVEDDMGASFGYGTYGTAVTAH